MKASFSKFGQKVLGEAGLRLISTTFVLLLARFVGAEEFGRYSTALAYAAVCNVIVDLGTNAIITREIARHPEEKIHLAKCSHFLKIVSAAASWLILYAITWVLHFDSRQRYLTLAMGIVVIGQTFAEYFSALLNGIEEMGWEAFLKILTRFLACSLGFIALFRHQSLETIAESLAIGTIAGYSISVLIIKLRFRSFGVAIDVRFMKSLLQACLPLFGSVIFWILYDSQDILLLNYFHFPQRSVGLFSAAMKIIDVAKVYPLLLMGVFFPTLSKLHVSDQVGFRIKKQKLQWFAVFSLAAVAGTLYIFAPWIIRFLYKTEYLPSADILRLLLPPLFVMGFNYIQVQFIIALNRERILLKAAFLVCAVNLALAFFLLPHFGIPGLCYALLGSEVIYFWFLRRAVAS